MAVLPVAYRKNCTCASCLLTGAVMAEPIKPACWPPEHTYRWGRRFGETCICGGETITTAPVPRRHVALWETA